MCRQIEHCKSSSVKQVVVGRKRVRERGSIPFQLPGALLTIEFAIDLLLSLFGRPRFLVAFLFLLPQWSGEVLVHTSCSSLWAHQEWGLSVLSAPLPFSLCLDSCGNDVEGVCRDVHWPLLCPEGLRGSYWHCKCVYILLFFQRKPGRTFAALWYRVHCCNLPYFYHPGKNSSKHYYSVYGLFVH